MSTAYWYSVVCEYYLSINWYGRYHSLVNQNIKCITIKLYLQGRNQNMLDFLFVGTSACDQIFNLGFQLTKSAQWSCTLHTSVQWACVEAHKHTQIGHLMLGDLTSQSGMLFNNQLWLWQCTYVHTGLVSLWVLISWLVCSSIPAHVFLSCVLIFEDTWIVWSF